MSDFIQKYIKQIALPRNILFKDMLKYAPSKLCGLIGNAIIVPIYTNLLSPAQYGIYAISLAVLSFLCIIFSDWVGLSGLRFFRKNELENKIPNYLSVLIIILSFNLALMYFFSYLFRNYFYSYFYIEPKYFLIILLLIIPVAIRALLFQLLRAQIKPGSYTVSTILNQILTIGFSVFIIKFFQIGAVSILIAMAISISLIDVLLLYQCNILKHITFKLPDWNVVKSLFMYGVPIAMASLSMWVINQSNKFITGYYYGMEQVGIVGVANNLTFPILMTLFSIIIIAAYPRVINLYEENIDVKPFISKLTGYYTLIALPIVVVLSIYAHNIVTMFVNSQFHSAYLLIPFFSFGAFFLSFTDYTTMQYHLANKTIVLTIIKVFSGIVGLCLNFYLIKTVGLIGVGLAVLIANLLYFILSVLIVVNDLKWQIPYKRFAHILFCFIPFIILFFVFKNTSIPVLAQIFIVYVSYYITYFATQKLFKDTELL